MVAVALGSLFSQDETRVIRPGSVVPYVLVGSDGTLSHKILTAESVESYSNWSTDSMCKKMKWAPSDPPEPVRT